LPPTEGEGEYWTDPYLNYGRGTQLSPAGVRFILDQYRQEKAARRDVFIKWATFFFAAIAAIGVISKAAWAPWN
jgi:hypothetical protein